MVDHDGLAVDAANNVYVTDAGNRRLLRIDREGKVAVLLRTDPPYAPNGVVAAPGGDLYVLEVGFTLPSSWSGPRVRRLSPNGKSTLLATVGAESDGSNVKATVARSAGAATESFLSFFTVGERTKYAIVIFSGGVLVAGAIWQRRRRQRA